MKKHFVKLLVGAFTILGLTMVLTACSVDPKPYNPNEKVGPQVNYTITGIDSGAGVMASTQKALNDYGLKSDKWQLQASSSAAMLAALKKAIQYHAPIVVTGWTPHWMFKRFPMKFLKDPKNSYGKAEDIDTIVHKGFDKQNPGAYRLLQNFHWNQDEMDDVMFKIDNGTPAAKAAKQFLKSNPELVKQWLNGVSQGHGQSVKLSLVTWDSELSSTNVVAELLKMKGYNVQIAPMELQPMWTSLSTGATDASTAGWLPITMGQYYKKFKGKVQIVRTNLAPARVGLAIPKYMKNINSISDLKNK